MGGLASPLALCLSPPTWCLRGGARVGCVCLCPPASGAAPRLGPAGSNKCRGSGRGHPVPVSSVSPGGGPGGWCVLSLGGLEPPQPAPGPLCWDPRVPPMVPPAPPPRCGAAADGGGPGPVPPQVWPHTSPCTPQPGPMGPGAPQQSPPLPRARCPPILSLTFDPMTRTLSPDNSPRAPHPSSSP